MAHTINNRARFVKYNPDQVDVFGKALCRLLKDKSSTLIKSYVRLFVEEIVVKDEEAIIKGIYAAMAQALHQMKMGTNNLVPTFIHDWCAEHDDSGYWEARKMLPRNPLS